MDKVVITTFLIIAGLVAALLTFNLMLPAINESSDAMLTMKSRLDQRMKSQVEIIHATGELDSSGVWQDVNGDGHFNIFTWTKNIGSARIPAIERMDLFFGPEGNFSRVPHESEAGGSYPYWSYEIENDADWNPTATLKVTIHYLLPLSSGRYFLKIVAPSGVEDDYFLSQ